MLTIVIEAIYEYIIPIWFHYYKNIRMLLSQNIKNISVTIDLTIFEIVFFPVIYATQWFLKMIQYMTYCLIELIEFFSIYIRK